MKYLKLTEDYALWLQALQDYQAALAGCAEKLGAVFPAIKSGFHDYRLSELRLEEAEEIKIYLTLKDFEQRQILEFSKVEQFEVTYEARNYRFTDESGKKTAVITDDGYGAVEVDELVLLENGKLSYEFRFFSGMHVLIKCAEIDFA